MLGEKHYIVWVVDGWMSMEQWWNDTDRGRQMTKINVNHCVQVSSPYRAVNTLRLSYENRSVNVV